MVLFQNTLNLLSSRTIDNKTILIKNIHKKYEGINAIRYNDANQFFQSLKDKNKKMKNIFYLVVIFVVKLQVFIVISLINFQTKKKTLF